MEIAKATKSDCHAIAELALIAGEGIPAYFWDQSRRPGQTTVDVGAQYAASETENFSYRNVHVAVIDSRIAGMVLAYRLPDAGKAEAPESYPEFIRLLIELEQCVPGSYYINMLAAYPKYRNRGVGRALMDFAAGVAARAGCSTMSVEVFEQNAGALRLYQHLGYTIKDTRPVVPHPCHGYRGRILLLTKSVVSGEGV